MSILNFEQVNDYTNWMFQTVNKLLQLPSPPPLMNTKLKVEKRDGHYLVIRLFN